MTYVSTYVCTYVDTYVYIYVCIQIYMKFRTDLSKELLMPITAITAMIIMMFMTTTKTIETKKKDYKIIIYGQVLQFIISLLVSLHTKTACLALLPNFINVQCARKEILFYNTILTLHSLPKLKFMHSQIFFFFVLLIQCICSE